MNARNHESILALRPLLSALNQQYAQHQMPAQSGTSDGKTLVESAIKMGVGRIVVGSD